MTTEKDEVVRIHVNLQIRSATLQTIVANTKMKAGSDAKGRYHVDPADKVAELISRFLRDNGFDAYAGDIGNYDENPPP